MTVRAKSMLLLGFLVSANVVVFLAKEYFRHLYGPVLRALGS